MKGEIGLGIQWGCNGEEAVLKSGCSGFQDPLTSPEGKIEKMEWPRWKAFVAILSAFSMQGKVKMD